MEKMAKNPVSENIKALRFAHNITQAELAKKAGIPRATLANMESRDSNPTLSGVIKVADALGVSIEDLVKVDQHHLVTVIKKEDMQITKMGDGKFLSTLLSPLNAPYILINRIKMLAGCDIKGKPHPIGSHEFFFCLEGKAELVINGNGFMVPAGDMIYFPGNLPHYYKNPTGMISRAISIVTAVDIPKEKKV